MKVRIFTSTVIRGYLTVLYEGVDEAHWADPNKRADYYGFGSVLTPPVVPQERRTSDE